jgi:LysR family transcriptional activator of nhaA
MTQPLEWLNYHHLHYFWMVAREGTIARAAERLRLTHPTVSTQIKVLEDAIGEKLFERHGRRLVLTEVGHVVNRYAEEIFSLGREMLDTVQGRPTGKPPRLVVGVADSVPKLLVGRLLEPMREPPHPTHVVCREGRPERLLAELATHEIDVVVSGSPAPAGSGIKVWSHLLGECGVSFFAAPALGMSRRGFPRSLDGAPIVLPTANAVLRQALEEWFDRLKLRPNVVAEVEDSALLKALGQAGWGVFAAPTALVDSVQEQYGVSVIGTTEEVRERFYAITAERKIKNPAVVAILGRAREQLFS